jgi:hypothetical protein
VSARRTSRLHCFPIGLIEAESAHSVAATIRRRRPMPRLVFDSLRTREHSHRCGRRPVAVAAWNKFALARCAELTKDGKRGEKGRHEVRGSGICEVVKHVFRVTLGRPDWQPLSCRTSAMRDNPAHPFLAFAIVALIALASWLLTDYSRYRAFTADPAPGTLYVDTWWRQPFVALRLVLGPDVRHDTVTASATGEVIAVRSLQLNPLKHVSWIAIVEPSWEERR